jgi:hypothetical protein
MSAPLGPGAAAILPFRLGGIAAKTTAFLKEREATAQQTTSQRQLQTEEKKGTEATTPRLFVLDEYGVGACAQRAGLRPRETANQMQDSEPGGEQPLFVIDSVADFDDDTSAQRSVPLYDLAGSAVGGVKRAEYDDHVIRPSDAAVDAAEDFIQLGHAQVRPPPRAPGMLEAHPAHARTPRLVPTARPRRCRVLPTNQLTTALRTRRQAAAP